MMRASVLASAATVAAGHGAVTYPPPRNAIDSDEKPWAQPVPTPVPFEPWCPYPSETAATVDPGRNLTGANGQACFWFSNGCAIGCESCDGSTRGPIPQFKGSGTDPLTPIPGAIDSGTGKPVQKEPICAQPLNATVCDRSQRTVNTGAECGSPDDFYYYSPWRRPGSAPVLDSCGTAGGRIPGQGKGGYGAQYQNTTHAKEGDLGSSLPHVPSGVVWKAGDVVEVSWTLQANHGGGYSYRLCPVDADTALDEECFKKTPLDFVGQSAFRWGGREGKVHKFNATYVTEGTSPDGSMWALNPVPRTWKDLETGEWAGNYHQTGEGFQPFCPNDKGNYSCVGMWGPYNMEIVDMVKIPDDLPAGAYVLGWRWDCEESNQIWASCSDVSIVV